MTAAAALPSRTYECGELCCQTYFAGKHAGPGPFYCVICGAELTLRPEGAEPYTGGVSLPENILPEQLPFAVLEKGA